MTSIFLQSVASTFALSIIATYKSFPKTNVSPAVIVIAKLDSSLISLMLPFILRAANSSSPTLNPPSFVLISVVPTLKVSGKVKLPLALVDIVDSPI